MAGRMMAGSKVPQLRIAVNSKCGKTCTYCRPNGEIAATPNAGGMSLSEIVRLTDLITQLGVSDIKLTGGDPGLYRDIVPLVAALRELPAIHRLELMTRHPRCGKRAADLRDAGLDQLNFSLDSLDPQTWSKITGTRGHEQLLAAIQEAAEAGIPIKINMVVLRGINDHEIAAMIAFCGRIGADLKLLDLIVDIGEFSDDLSAYADTHYHDLAEIVSWLESSGAASSIHRSSGGLGHPMPTFQFADGTKVRVKTARSGAWYGDVCRGCKHFPCHDALMALRLTPDGKLQRCLLRSDNLVDLLTPLRTGASENELRELIADAMATYHSAEFYEHWQIMRLRGLRQPPYYTLAFASGLNLEYSAQDHDNDPLRR
jgi:cyclic pyranopterin phosphate synthase